MATFGKDAFREGLEELGIVVTDKGGNLLAFPYTIKEGRFKGRDITVGLEIPSDFNVTCPTGPHITPRLIPINTGAMDNTRAADSGQFGADWQYLSRPFGVNQQRWPQTKRDVTAYLRHIARILENL